ncbi:MAG: septum formation initiator family protein [Planctomycetaceae bacterium]
MATHTQQPETTDNDSTWIVSVVFWLTLFVAAALYAMVALSPKLERLLTLKRDHEAGQWHLVELEKRVKQLDRVAAALEDDPQFAAELARSRFGAVRPGSDAIPLSNELQINFTDSPPDLAEVQLPWFYGVIRQFASNSVLRWTSLGVASGLILLGFGFLHARYAMLVRAAIGRVATTASRFGQRYQSKKVQQ